MIVLPNVLGIEPIEPSTDGAHGCESFEDVNISISFKGTSGFLGVITRPNVLGIEPTGTDFVGLVAGVDSLETGAVASVGFFGDEPNFSPPTAILPNVVGAYAFDGLLLSKKQNKRHRKKMERR